jgi:iron complex transport system permease protein
VTESATRLTPTAVIVSLGALLGAVALGVLTGPADIAPAGALREILGHLPLVDLTSTLDEQQASIVWQIRLPRVALGALVGGTLAVAGAAYQGVFRNPLVDPYLLGVAAGAGLGATVVFAMSASGGPLLPIGAFAGAVVAVVATYALGRSAGGRSTATLVLAGVAMASFFTAAQSYVQQRSSADVRRLYGWILGRLSTTGWGDVALAAPYVAVSLVVIFLSRRLLDVLAVDDAEAAALGVSPPRVRRWVVAAATLGTAAVVAVSGLIAFVGIIVPHTIRLLAGTSYRRVIPLSLILGAAFLVAADVAARTMVSPAELPIGVVTAFLGAPFFLVVLRANRRVS